MCIFCRVFYFLNCILSGGNIKLTFCFARAVPVLRPRPGGASIEPAISHGVSREVAEEADVRGAGEPDEEPRDASTCLSLYLAAVYTDAAHIADGVIGLQQRSLAASGPTE